MKTKLVTIVALSVAVGLLTLGCRPPSDPTSAGTQLSSAFFSVPTSLTGPSVPKAIGARTVDSDSWVRSAVESYYATVREQVRFGAEVAQSLRALLQDLEQIKIGDTFLLDGQTNLTHTAADGQKFRWTAEAAGSFFLEVWAAGGGKSLELRFTRSGSRYAGTAVAAVANLAWTQPVPPVKLPEWVKTEFDTDSDGLGTARLVLSVQGFRYHADLDPGLENGTMVLTKDSAGLVRLGSIIQGTNSRHFVWNGYTLNTSNVAALNAGAAVETRYYTAAGAANSANQATVYLGIPVSPVDTTVFTGNGVGALVNQLFADRLNNDYDFDGSADTASDQGHEIVTLLNTINNPNPVLDTTEPVHNNSAASVLAALQAAQTNLGASTNDNVDYLLGMMSVTNPAYFLENTYQSYGAVVPTGWPAIAESDARALLPTQATVDSMAVAFESALTPGF